VKINRRIAVPVVAGVAVLAVAGGAWAVVDSRGDHESQERGTCAATSYELSAENEDGGIEASFELQSSAPGETWDVELRHNGRALVSGTRTTDEDAEVDLDAFVGDRSGKHVFDVTFTGPDGKACTATLRH
jgi:hypothetical protein